MCSRIDAYLIDIMRNKKYSAQAVAITPTTTIIIEQTKKNRKTMQITAKSRRKCREGERYANAWNTLRIECCSSVAIAFQVFVHNASAYVGLQSVGIAGNTASPTIWNAKSARVREIGILCRLHSES